MNRFAESGMAVPSEFGHHWTWDEFKDLAIKLTRRDAEGEVEFLQDLHHDLGVIEDRGHGAFWRGEAAIFVDGPSYTANHHDAGANFDYALGHMPMRERGGSETLPIGVAMGSQTQHPDEAWRWMRYLATEAAYDHIALTSRPPAWDQAARQFVDYFPNPSPWEHVWIETLMHPDTYFRPVVPSRVQDEMTTYVDQVLKGEMSPAAAIAIMQDTGSAILREIWAGRE